MRLKFSLWFGFARPTSPKPRGIAFFSRTVRLRAVKVSARGDSMALVLKFKPFGPEGLDVEAGSGEAVLEAA